MLSIKTLCLHFRLSNQWALILILKNMKKLGMFLVSWFVLFEISKLPLKWWEKISVIGFFILLRYSLKCRRHFSVKPPRLTIEMGFFAVFAPLRTGYLQSYLWYKLKIRFSTVFRFERITTCKPILKSNIFFYYN